LLIVRLGGEITCKTGGVFVSFVLLGLDGKWRGWGLTDFDVNPCIETVLMDCVPRTAILKKSPLDANRLDCCGGFWDLRELAVGDYAPVGFFGMTDVHAR
jgi:hypothetical protein